MLSSPLISNFLLWSFLSDSLCISPKPVPLICLSNENAPKKSGLFLGYTLRFCSSHNLSLSIKCLCIPRISPGSLFVNHLPVRGTSYSVPLHPSKELWTQNPILVEVVCREFKHSWNKVRGYKRAWQLTFGLFHLY